MADLTTSDVANSCSKVPGSPANTDSIYLSDYLVGSAPPTIHYIPNFISESEEEELTENVYNSPKPKWVQLSNRRLQNWGGLVGKRALISDGNVPEWLAKYIDRIYNRPNHVLINEYIAGQGIMAHSDGSAYFPLVSTISLRSHTLLDFYKDMDENLIGSENSPPAQRVYVGSMFLEPRSLVLIRDDAYSKLLHAIEETECDNFDEKKVFNQSDLRKYLEIDGNQVQQLRRTTRVSLTIRNVPKVNKAVLSTLLKKP
ncbi:2OG-Fe(II) oxygenase superfamily domain-containing protein [Ditylenchus destructor]|uniref:2OG-Fe(II) oxygenase superfamily domain-containing protein n=1 Tax=Ditylenchus destructor TaxID=166010 RepID=A0AAD4R204_9BILA|nr:2OG-Fe(II) oxygenase superfamily domain-containing protein [Ditylenchus destructor]